MRLASFSLWFSVIFFALYKIMSPILECKEHAVIVMQRAALPVVFVQFALAAPALCRA